MANLKVREGKVCPFDRRMRYIELCFSSGAPVRKPGGTFIAPASKATRIVEAVNRILESDDQKPLGPVELGLMREEPVQEKPTMPWHSKDYYGKKVG